MGSAVSPGMHAGRRTWTAGLLGWLLAAGCTLTPPGPGDGRPGEPAVASCGGAKCDEGGEPEPPGELGAEREVWAVMQSHLHTTGMHDCANDPLDPGPLPEGACYSADGIEGFLEAALDYGASDMIITDHNNVDAWFDPAFAPMPSDDWSRYATPLRGSEWSSGEGHMTVFFSRQVVEDNLTAFEEGWLWASGNHVDPSNPQEYRQAIESVHARGGLVAINHPELLIHPFGEDAFGADAVEVGVKLKPVLQSTSATRMWWHRRLVAEDRLTGMAGADHHHGGSDVPLVHEPIFGVAVNLVRLDPALPDFVDAYEAVENAQTTIDQRSDLVADAIRRGHVMIVEDLDSPRVYLGADVDGDGRHHDARAGDCIPPEAVSGGAIEIHIRVAQPDLEDIGGGHYNVLFFTEASGDGEWFWAELDPQSGFERSSHYEIDPADPFSIRLRVPYDPDAAGFFRIELEHDRFGPFNDTKTITNPIYFGDWGEECAGSFPLF